MMSESRLFRTILCPVDFSHHSREALGYAAALASRRKGRLVVIFVEDPLLVAAAALRYDQRTLIDKGRMALRRFVERAVKPYGVRIESVALDVAVGRPDERIGWTAENLKCDLIVMGSHGWTGANRMMLGSTTQRVLRKARLPVLAIPPAPGRGRGPAKGWPGKWVLAPVDLGSGDRADALAAAVATRELGAQMMLVHVVEPVAEVPWLEIDAARRNLQRERRALAHLTRLKDDLAWAVSDCRVESGKPAEVIAKLASANSVGLVVMTRRKGQGLLGPRQGSISYQVLLRAKTPVLALPSDKAWMRRAIRLRPRESPPRRSP
jgi:nucleotide-binding universal stress UspA family protein